MQFQQRIVKTLASGNWIARLARRPVHPQSVVAFLAVKNDPLGISPGSLKNRFILFVIAAGTKPMLGAGRFLIWIERVNENTRLYVCKRILAGLGFPILYFHQLLFESVFLCSNA